MVQTPQADSALVALVLALHPGLTVSGSGSDYFGSASDCSCSPREAWSDGALRNALVRLVSAASNTLICHSHEFLSSVAYDVL